MDAPREDGFLRLNIPLQDFGLAFYPSEDRLDFSWGVLVRPSTVFKLLLELPWYP